MRALVVRQPWANLIASGEKTIEVRTWSTAFRGDLVICSAKQYDPCFIGDDIEPLGATVCLVSLIDVRPLRQSDACAAMLPRDSVTGSLFAWVLDHARRLKPCASVNEHVKVGGVQCEAGFTVAREQMFQAHYD